MRKGPLFKKGISAILSALLLTQGVGTVPSVRIHAEEEKVYYYGDVDGDECLTVFDLVLMKRGYLKPESQTDLQTAICDVSSNGEFDTEDIRLMQDYLLARINAFPSGSIYTPPETEPEEPPYNGQKTLTGRRMYEYLDRGTYAVSAGNASSHMRVLKLLTATLSVLTATVKLNIRSSRHINHILQVGMTIMICTIRCMNNYSSICAAVSA